MIQAPSPPLLSSKPGPPGPDSYPEVTFGSFVSIGTNVSIGPNTVIGNHVTLHDDVSIGFGVRIDDNAVIGKLPLRSANSAVTQSATLPPAHIGDRCLIGTNVVIYRGAYLAPAVLVADLASVREHTYIGELTIIGRGVAIENEVTIGMKCKIETGAYITAKSTIGSFCFIAPEVTFTNDNFVGRTEQRFKHFGGVVMHDGARIAANATILPGIVIGADALVAAGSVVTRPVPAGMIVMGSPARVIRPVPLEQLLSPPTLTTSGGK